MKWRAQLALVSLPSWLKFHFKIFIHGWQCFSPNHFLFFRVVTLNLSHCVFVLFCFFVLFF